MGNINMGHAEDYLRTQDSLKTTEIETPFVDTSKDIVYLPHFKEDAWKTGEAYKIKTTMETCVAWVEWAKNHNSDFANTHTIERLTKDGLVMFFFGFCDYHRSAQFMYIVGVQPVYLTIPIEMYMRGTIEIWPV